MMRFSHAAMLAFLVCTTPFSAIAVQHPLVLRSAEFIAIQDGGRVKPLATYARFSLLQLNGRTTVTLDNGTQTAMAWLMECLLEPTIADMRPVFLIENPEVMNALSLPATRPRQRFSYDELLPSKSTLARLAMQYGALPESARGPAQKQALQLAHNLRHYEALRGAFETFQQQPPLGEWLKEGLGQALNLRDPTAATAIMAMRESDLLALLPPDPLGDAPETWLTPAALADRWVAGHPPTAPQVEAWLALERLANTGLQAGQGAIAIGQLRNETDQALLGNREYAQIPREVAFYRLNPFGWALGLYLVAFIAVAISWTLPWSRFFRVASFLALLPPITLHIYGITQRCLIRGRPPISSLYETILFVGAVTVLAAIVLELFNRRRVALGIAAVAGAASLFLAARYEAVERADTMPNLMAVLDTNFWLSTHVTTITIGYAAGLLASLIAHVYLTGKVLGLRREDPAFYADLTRMVYGVLCFGLFFSTLGTLLGGIWATQSWGRFWGWDPKENGALMIVLWGLAVLHARLGGYLRDDGLHMAALFGGLIVAFSWFGVNLLGVGMHSYGFTSGIHTALTGFYLAESILLTIAAISLSRAREDSAV